MHALMYDEITGDAIIITKSLESGGGCEEGEEARSSPEDEEQHSAASRVTLSKHTNATTGR